jgi:MSHA pilin protein MshC
MGRFVMGDPFMSLRCSLVHADIGLSSPDPVFAPDCGRISAACRAASRVPLPTQRVRGFTLIELVVVLVVVGILAVFVAPRFNSIAVFNTRGFADQVGAALRFAQKAAIARRGYACVTTAPSSLTLSAGSTTTCGTPLAIPGTSGSVLNAPAGVTLSSTTFYFTALGKAVPGATVTVTGDGTSTITVEGETGYVH